MPNQSIGGLSFCLYRVQVDLFGSGFRGIRKKCHDFSLGYYSCCGMRLLAVCVLLVLFMFPVLRSFAQSIQKTDLSSLDLGVASALNAIRVRTNLPALAGAIVTSDGVLADGVVGVRKDGSDIAATIQDDWHLGSDTKAMTATLIGMLIDQGKLHFESTIADVFPELSTALPKGFQSVTVEQLLIHQGGLPHDPEGGWRQFSSQGSLVAQRLASVRAVGDAMLNTNTSTGFNYSNWGYVILGAIAERVTGAEWEDLMRDRVFVPLKMEHVGFGGTGTPGEIDQPWPHINGKPLPSNGPSVDNLPVMAPAGAVHCPIRDWAKFIANELAGLQDKPSLLSPGTFKRLHTPASGGSYAGGWICVQRGWARGMAYNHAGSNTMNYAVAWLAPQRDVAFLVCTNEGNASKPSNDAFASLRKLYDSTKR